MGCLDRLLQFLPSAVIFDVSVSIEDGKIRVIDKVKAVVHLFIGRSLLVLSEACSKVGENGSQVRVVDVYVAIKDVLQLLLLVSLLLLLIIILAQQSMAWLL